MNIDKARKLMGEDSKKYTDDQILHFIETARFFAEIAIEKINKMTPEELKKFKKNNNKVR